MMMDAFFCATSLLIFLTYNNRRDGFAVFMRCTAGLSFVLNFVALIAPVKP